MSLKLTRRLLAAAVLTAAALAPAAPSMADDSTGVGLIEIHGRPTAQPHALAWLIGTGEHPTLRQVIDLFKEAGENDNLKGVVVRLRETELTTTQVEEIGQAMQRLRDKGKKVHLFADNYQTAELLLGAYADEVIIQSGGGIMFPGMHMEEMYMADTFAWVGITPQMVQVGDYKGANEQYMNAGPSPAWDKNISGLLDALYGNVRTRLKTGRKLNDAQLDDAMKASWMALAETGKRVGLIDSIVDLPVLSAHLEKEYKTDIAWTNFDTDSEELKIDASNPLALLSRLSREPRNTPTREAIAIVHIDGPIMDGRSREGGLFGEASVGSTTIRRALEEIRDEDLIKGVIVRIDSPGGSAIASEVIWQGLKRVGEKKPVWISVGSMAASGGYYCLVAGDKVYVNPSSIVGSIGVVGGKMALGGVYDHLKLRIKERSRGPMGEMMSSATPWTDDQKAAVRTKMKETYDLFTSRVSAGRAGIDLSRTAEGRLFTGNDAVALKMADKVGSLDDCIADLAKEKGLTAGEFQILEYPGPKSLADAIGEMLGGSTAAPNLRQQFAEDAGAAMAVGILKQMVGEKRWPAIRDQLSAFMQLRSEPVLLTSPTAVIVK